MSKTIILTPTPTTRISIAVEGNDLVQRVFTVDPTKPRLWVDGTEYQFNSRLTSTTQVPGKLLPKLVFAYTKEPA